MRWFLRDTRRWIRKASLQSLLSWNLVHYTQERKKNFALHLSLHRPGWTCISSHSCWTEGGIWASHLGGTGSEEVLDQRRWYWMLILGHRKRENRFQGENTEWSRCIERSWNRRWILRTVSSFKSFLEVATFLPLGSMEHSSTLWYTVLVFYVSSNKGLSLEFRCSDLCIFTRTDQNNLQPNESLLLFLVNAKLVVLVIFLLFRWRNRWKISQAHQLVN